MRVYWLVILILAIYLMGITGIEGTVWSYDFGNIDKNHTTGTSSDFFPDTLPWNSKVLAQSGGTFHLQEDAFEIGSGHILRMQSATSTPNRASFYSVVDSLVVHYRMNILFGNSEGSSASPAMFFFYLGSGTMFTDLVSFTSVQVFSGFRWNIESDSSITPYYLNGTKFTAFSDYFTFNQGIVYHIEIFGNNSNEDREYHFGNGIQSLGAYKQDIWINGILRADDLSKGNLGGGSINGIAWHGSGGSTTNSANIFIDNLYFSDELPQNHDPTLPVELSSFTAAISNDNKVNLMWTTESETNCLGFRIYRGLNGDVEQAELISSLISATNTSTQQSYIYPDKSISQSGEYYYWLQNVDLDGQTGFHGPAMIRVNFEDDLPPSIPLVAGIHSVYPNPFNPQVQIKYCLDTGSDARILIYNNKGQVVRELSGQNMLPGYHKETWDGTNDQGKACGTGVYLIRLEAGERKYTAKAVLLK